MNNQKNLVYSWFFQRITGLILVVGLLFHFLFLHFFIEKPLSFEKVIERVSGSVPWIIFDLCLLFFAIYHGLNGSFQIICDFKINKKLRKIIGYLFFVIGLITFYYGLSTLFHFV